MFRIINIIILFSLILFPTSLKAHLDHYKNLNRLEFDIYRNNNHIGTHIFFFSRKDEKLEVKSVIDFQIKKFGVVLYKYHAEGVEVYKDGKLIEFSSTTKQNKKDKYVNMFLENNNYIIDGSSYKGKAPVEFVLGTWWNHSIVEAEAQISAVSGRIIKQKVEFLGKEIVKFDNESYNALHFNFSSTDKKLDKKKKLNTDVWYDEVSLNWIKATFDKSGKWEYKLKTIK